ncbi:MAG: hypothetical protein AB8B91_24355 [Rubripirellula sp.]
MVAKHFVSAHQQVGDFRVIKVGNQVNKNGGNVATHFLTASGHLIHSVTGPVSAKVLLKEARWAIDLHQQAQEKPFASRAGFVSSAHQTASMSPENGQDRQVHMYLASTPMPRIEEAYTYIFQNILGQAVSRAGPRLASAKQIIERAQRSGSPILFVLHEGHAWSRPSTNATTTQLMNKFFILPMPLREAPALSQLTKQPPYESEGGTARPLYVIADSDCKQIRSVAGYHEGRLALALAEGYAVALERNPPDVRTLVKAQRLMRDVDAKDLLGRVRQLTIRVQKAQQEARASLDKTASL